MAHAYSGQGKWFDNQRTPKMARRDKPRKYSFDVRMKCSRRYHLLRNLGVSVDEAYAARTNYKKFCASLRALGKDPAEYPELGSQRYAAAAAPLAPEFVRQRSEEPGKPPEGAQEAHRPNAPSTSLIAPSNCG